MPDPLPSASRDAPHRRRRRRSSAWCAAAIVTVAGALGGCSSSSGDAAPRVTTTLASRLTTEAERVRIAFASTRTTPDGRESSRIVVSDARGERPRIVADLGGLAESPSWSPDGSTIVFDADTAGQFDIWLAAADGSGARNLTPDAATDGWPIWSPDGTAIVFFSNRENPPGSFDLWTVRPDGTGLRRLTRVGATRSVTQPTWSPDGARIAFTVEIRDQVSEIWTMRPDGSEARNLTGALGGFAPTWSPDGSHLAFVAQRAGDRAGRIYVMRADGTGARPVSRPQLGDTQPAWSTDGSFIAYQATIPGDDGVQTDIFVVRPDGRDARNLTRTPVAQERRPTWSPDGRLVAFTRTFMRDDQVLLTDVAGSGVLDVSRSPQRADTGATFAPDAGRTR